MARSNVTRTELTDDLLPHHGAYGHRGTQRHPQAAMPAAEATTMAFRGDPDPDLVKPYVPESLA